MIRIGQLARQRCNNGQTQRIPNLFVPFDDIESLVLELAELWALLDNDGVDAEQIVKKLDYLLLPISLSCLLASSIDDIVRQHLVAIDLVYHDLHADHLHTLLWPAKVWATTFAARHAARRWAEHHVLDFKHRLPSTWRLELGPNSPTKNVAMSGSISDLDWLLKIYRYWPLAREIRRLKARSQPDDRLAGFYSPCSGRNLDTARYGVGLIRRGVMIDRIVTRRRATAFS